MCQAVPTKWSNNFQAGSSEPEYRIKNINEAKDGE
jgi:hypothetical protein